MLQQNQLLFNLNVPSNPMNMMTQFHNPGPVVIERLAGKTADGRNGPTIPSPAPEPVQFSVVSKENLSFAIQLARRDMKNKIREQQQQHQKQQVEKKDGIPKLKKDARKKISSRKTERNQQPPTSRYGQNVNKKSVKTQTPPPKHVRQNFRTSPQRDQSPILVLKTQPQDYSDFERTKVRVDSVQGKEQPSKSPKVDKDGQTREITRLNKELKTCMEKINVLTKQVAEKTSVSSPDRTATLKAGLEALMRAETLAKIDKSPIPSPKVVKTSTIRQRKPVHKKSRALPSSGLILPMKPKRPQQVSGPVGDMHFAIATQSSMIKAKISQESVKSNITGKEQTKPVWSPPGTPKSFHRIQRVPRIVQPPQHSHGDRDEDKSDTDSVLDYGGRQAEISDQGRTRENRMLGLNERSKSESEDKVGQKAMWVERQLHNGLSSTTSLRSAGEKGTHHSDHGDGWHSHHRLRTDLHPERKSLSNMHSSDQVDDYYQPGRKSVRRRMEFDRADTNLHEAASARLYRKHDAEPLRSQDAVPHVEDRPVRHSKETRDLVTDLLVDEILDDAVTELQKMDTVAKATSQVQVTEDASTLENILQDLERMEAEEDRIRRRWKQVWYEDPKVTRSSQGQIADFVRHEQWMKGTPIDAQQMEQMDSIPAQHTSMYFTKSKPEMVYETNTEKKQDVNKTQPNFGKDDDDEENLLQHIVITSSSIPKSETQRNTAVRLHASSTHRGSENRQIPVFVPTDMMKRIQENKETFKNHLKRTSHQPYGTFDPWKLVERISDDLVDDIIQEVTGEVSDVIGQYVETLYASEFDIKDEGASKNEL